MPSKPSTWLALGAAALFVSLSIRASAETAAAAGLAREMVEAHGGVQAWNRAASVSYEHELQIPGDDKPWISRETIEQKPARRLYQDWLSHGGQVVWDGSDVWTVDYALGNPAELMPFLTYTALVAPWLTQDRGTVLAGPARGSLPGDDEEYLVLTMRLPTLPGRPPVASYYQIYVHPESKLMKGIAYGIDYGPMLDRMGLPAEVTEIGPMTHVYDEYARVAGLHVPVKYHTIGPDGQTVVGRHEVRDWSFTKPFDESRMTRPRGAVVHEVTAERKGSS